MARITKLRARAPLADGRPGFSWGESRDTGEQYRIRVQGETHTFHLELTPNETKSFIDYIAGRETFRYGHESINGNMGWTDKRTLPEKLRAWADKLEAQANG